MNSEQNTKCHAIIHSAAAAAAGGNVVPVPGLGVAADTLAMTTMVMSLASVFGRSIPENVAKGMAIVALKRTLLKQPLKVVTKELSKFIPFLGSVVAPAVSAALIEAAGWQIVNEIESGSYANA